MKCQAIIAAAVAVAWAATAHADESSLATSHDLGKENGRLCMTNHGHTGSATGSTKVQARAGAIRSWIEFTNFEYGSSWASFAVAAGLTTRYTKEEKGWTATVDARPCKR